MMNSENRSAWFYPLLLTSVFILSRLLFHAMGVRFDASGIDWYWQYLDMELLKSDLLRSVYYQHSQPPGFNLFLGIVLKLFPNAYLFVVAFIFKGLGLALYYLIFRTLNLAGFRPRTAFLAATLFILAPTAVLYENWLFYTWPTAVLLAGAAHRLLLFETRRRTRDALLYLAVVAAVCLTRSMFHLVYLIAACIPVLVMGPRLRRRTGTAAAVAILLVGGLFVKNLLLFGFFGSSSWMGMNLWKIAPTGGKSEQLAGSAVARIEPFSPIMDYPETLRRVPAAFADIPALADGSRQNGRPNLNHIGYITVSEAYGQEAAALIKGDLPGYAHMVAKAWGLYLSPARIYPLLSPQNKAALKGLFLLSAPADPRLLVPLGLLLSTLGLSGRFFPLAGKHKRTAVPVFYLFCVGTVFYTALLGNALEHGENMRFRVQTDPLLYLAALYVLRQIRLRRAGRGSLLENHGE